jgi:hypothetical protein
MHRECERPAQRNGGLRLQQEHGWAAGGGSGRWTMASSSSFIDDTARRSAFSCMGERAARWMNCRFSIVLRAAASAASTSQYCAWPVQDLLALSEAAGARAWHELPGLLLTVEPPALFVRLCFFAACLLPPSAPRVSKSLLGGRIAASSAISLGKNVHRSTHHSVRPLHKDTRDKTSSAWHRKGAGPVDLGRSAKIRAFVQMAVPIDLEEELERAQVPTALLSPQ